jgi:DnaJ-class molecular chaperone
MSENYYNVLGVDENSSKDEIKKAYRVLQMKWHPDKNPGNQEAINMTQKLNEAYETLGDPEKKQEYDNMQNNPFIKMMNNPGTNGYNPMNDLFANLFGGIPLGHMDSFGMGQQPGPGSPFGGGLPFGANVRIFHNGTPLQSNINGFSQAMNKPTPIIQTITVSIDKILTGTTIPVNIERWIIENGNKVFENETVYVQVPKGIDDGEIIILRERGNVIREDCKSDIKLFIKIENNTDFKRIGLDLIFEKTISVKEALCGFTFELKYITGKVYTINNNSGNIISNGYRKIIPNMGLSRDSHTGNLIIIFNVKFPEKLNNGVIEELVKIDF